MCNRTRTRTRTGFIQNQNQNRIVAQPMADTQTLMCFVSMRMGQQIASKIATVLKKAIHVKMTHRAKCVTAGSFKHLMSRTFALPTTKIMDPGKHAWKIVAQKSAYKRLQPLVLRM